MIKKSDAEIESEVNLQIELLKVSEEIQNLSIKMHKHHILFRNGFIQNQSQILESIYRTLKMWSE